MAVDGLFTALSALTSALLLGAGVYVYGSLARQISVRAGSVPATATRTFSWGDAVLAILLSAWFVLNTTAAAAHSITTLRTRDLAANALFSIALLVFVALFLRLRGLNLDALGGFSRLSFRRAMITGAVLLIAAYPLIFLADTIGQRILGRGSERQAIVELFNASTTLEQRIMIIILAVAIAPVAEEFLFRFFLYGVLKRYFGRALALVGNAFLFALVHAHLPSFAPLFVLASCFTIAFEWSGSILVCMTMHALFNSLTLTALAFPNLFQQQ
ncbi:MAG: CPBP family intramembrane glutamic endopeptidase [Chthoniobacterales bacterium]